jgi:hypothetical protein
MGASAAVVTPLLLLLPLLLELLLAAPVAAAVTAATCWIRRCGGACAAVALFTVTLKVTAAAVKP